MRIRGDPAWTRRTCSLGKVAGEEEDSARAKVPFRREPGPLSVFAAPGASPLFLLRRNGVEQVGNPFLHPSHGGCLPSTAPGGKTLYTPTRLAVGGGEPPSNPAP